MEFWQDVFIKYWKEIIVLVLLVLTRPFFLKYVRELRKDVIIAITRKKHLEQALTDANNRCEETERKYQSEVEKRCRAEAEFDNLRKEAEAEIASLREELDKSKRLFVEAMKLLAVLTNPEQVSNTIEKANPAPGKLTAKLLELLRACKALPFPKDNQKFVRVPSQLMDFLPPNGDILRMKLMRAINQYIGKISRKAKQNIIEAKDTAEKQCTVLYVLILIAHGVYDEEITIDDSEELTWKKVSALIDKINAKYFNEHPEAGSLSDDQKLSGREFIASAFSSCPTEILLKDKVFIATLLPSAMSTTTVILYKIKGFLGKLFGQ